MLISGNTGFLFFDWHRQVGELVLALMVFRLGWGIVGSSNVRLHRLITSPKAALLHLQDVYKRQASAERGHNAAGSWAVIIMLLMLSIQAITGLYIADEDELVEGALYGTVSGSVSDLMHGIHHTNAELLQIVIVVHIAMVFLYLLFGKQNLILPMFTGRMKWLSENRAPHMFFQKPIIGFMVAVASAVLIGYLANWF